MFSGYQELVSRILGGYINLKYDQYAPQIVQIPRPQRKPLLFKENPRLRTVSFNAILADKNTGGTAILEGDKRYMDILKYITENALPCRFIYATYTLEFFVVDLVDIKFDIRRQAKAINFGVIYGISGFGLARNLRIPRSEAQGFIDRYFERFPGIKEYMDKTVKFSKENNYVETLFGRVIHTPEINAKGPMAGFAKRAAINAPIQGTAADIIRRAMIRVPDVIKDLPAKMLLQVHDELLFEVKEEYCEDLIAKVQSIMEEASLPFLKMDIPLSVDAGRGMNWAEAH